MNPVSLYERRDELRRVLQSKQFAKARRKSRFLEFICEQAFLGNAEKLNEYLIGVEIYERGADFNPQDDPIVRVQAHGIRRALRQYYEEEGRDALWRIDLPAGHYVPVFSRVDSAAETPAASTVAERPAGPPPSGAWRSNIVILALALGCVVLGLLLLRERSLDRRPALPRPAASLPESMAWFWKPFLPPAAPPLVAIPNHLLLRAAHQGDTSSTLARSFLIPKDKFPEFRDTIHFRELRGFFFVPSLTDFTSVGETLGLLNLFDLFSGVGQKPRLKASRLIDFEELKKGNAILLGGNQAWSGRIFLYPQGFHFQAGVILNKQPKAGERPVYKPEFDPITNSLTRDYALVLMLPNARKEERILLIYGIYTQGSQAAIEYITSGEGLQELRKALVELAPDKKTPPALFQVLLETTVENYVPGKTSFVAGRVIEP